VYQTAYGKGADTFAIRSVLSKQETIQQLGFSIFCNPLLRKVVNGVIVTIVAPWMNNGVARLSMIRNSSDKVEALGVITKTQELRFCFFADGNGQRCPVGAKSLHNNYFRHHYCMRAATLCAGQLCKLCNSRMLGPPLVNKPRCRTLILSITFSRVHLLVT
jgi:hypothetical protein